MLKKVIIPLLFLFCRCAGYLWGNIAPLGYSASGVPVTLGGVGRVHLGEHWLLGAGKELYMPGGPRFYVGFIFCH